MLRPRRYALGALAVLTAVLLTLTVAAALRDTTPPRLYVEAPTRLPVGAPLGLFVSADEPVTYVLEYGGARVERVDQDATFDVPAVPGAQPARLIATDGAGNVTERDAVVIGVPELAPVLSAPAAARSGDPIGLSVAALPGPKADAATTAAVSSVTLTVDGAEIPLLADADGGYRGMLAAPMSVDPLTLQVGLVVVDEFGRSLAREASVVLEPLPVEVEQLRLSAATLAVITPEGRELEANTVAAAWAGALPAPQWKEPFAPPIEGVTTSGFGDARRYEQGGPVSYHYGLDLAVPQGTPVHATNAGVVVVAGAYPIKGGWVAIDHGAGLMSYYFHMSEVRAAVGQRVDRGDVIGLVGTTGLSTGPHLHWEMRVRGVASSPLAWVGKTYP